MSQCGWNDSIKVVCVWQLRKRPSFCFHAIQEHRLHFQNLVAVLLVLASCASPHQQSLLAWLTAIFSWNKCALQACQTEAEVLDCCYPQSFFFSVHERLRHDTMNCKNYSPWLISLTEVLPAMPSSLPQSHTSTSGHLRPCDWRQHQA